MATIILIADQLNIDKETVHMFNNEDLGSTNLCAYFVLQVLTTEQMEEQVAVYQDFLQT